MNIHLIDKNKFIAELSDKDMNDLDITYEEMDYSNIETRRVIWLVIDKIRETSGCDIDPSGNLLIEAVADSEGGCVLCFTVTEKRRAVPQHKAPVLKKNRGGAVYEFESMDSLLDMIKTVGYKNLSGKCRVFKSDGHVRLIMSRLPGLNEKKSIEEFGQFIGQDDYLTALTAEHWEKAGGF